MAGVLGLHLDEHEPVLGELPHRLGVVRQEAGSRSQQPLVPGQCPAVVGDRDPGEEVDGHVRTVSA
jgi:hypothetical protein